MHSRKLLAALVGAAILIAEHSVPGHLALPEPPLRRTRAGLTASRFELTIDGHSLAVFQELVGIVSGVDGAGSDLALVTKGDDSVLKVPGKRTPPTITLRRAMTRNIEMAAWHELVLLGDVEAATKSVSITAYNKKGDPVARYHLTDAWPSKLEITAESSAAGGVMEETVTFVAEFMQRVSV